MLKDSLSMDDAYLLKDDLTGLLEQIPLVESILKKLVA